MSFWKRLKYNPGLRARLAIRASLIAQIRTFFTVRGFLEVDTPLLVKHPGLEPHLNPLETDFITDTNAHASSALITSPEFALKKLLAAGYTHVFQLNKCWRGGEPYGGTHNPEFTMLEWYRAHADYRDLMRDCEELVNALHAYICNNRGSDPHSPLVYQNMRINLAAPWQRLSVRDAWQIYANLHLDELLTREAMARAVMDKELTVNADDDFDDLFFKIFLTYIEPNFPRETPLILYDYPIQLAALARPCPADPRYAERFEFYIGGIEIGNGYSELVDAEEQQKRFLADQAKRRQLGKNVYTIDTDFIEALESGVPPSAGYSIGVDRVVMLFTDAASIEDVIYFPASDVFN